MTSLKISLFAILASAQLTATGVATDPQILDQGLGHRGQMVAPQGFPQGASADQCRSACFGIS